MKYLLMLILLFSSCTLYQNIEAPELSTLEDINQYVFRNIDYLSEQYNYPQSPIETMELQTGDCEDYAILFMFLAFKNLYIKPDLIVVDTGESIHSIVYYDGIYYDPTYNSFTDALYDGWTIKYKFKYDTVLLYSTAFYTKEITWQN